VLLEDRFKLVGINSAHVHLLAIRQVAGEAAHLNLLFALEGSLLLAGEALVDHGHAQLPDLIFRCFSGLVCAMAHIALFGANIDL